MNIFGEENVSHNLPLIFVSGVPDTVATQETLTKSHDGGFRVRTDLPLIESDLASIVTTAIYEHDGSQAPWRTANPPSRLFTIRNVGRVGWDLLCGVWMPC